MYSPGQDAPSDSTDWFAQNDPSKLPPTTAGAAQTPPPAAGPAANPNFLNQPGIAGGGQWGGGWDQSFATPLAHALQAEIANGLSGQAAIDAIAKDYPQLASQVGQIQYYPAKGQYGLPGNMYVAPNAQNNGALDLIQRPGQEGAGGSLIAPFSEPFNAPAPIDLGGPGGLPNAPTFTPPSFQAPTAASVLSDPGYQFRLGQGEQALQQSAAGQGVLNTGGTLKDVLQYGQNFASNEFQNAWNRNLDVYNTAFQGAKAAFDPKMTAFTTQSNLIPGINQNNYMNAYQKWLSDYNQYRNQKLDTFNMQDTVATQ